MERERKEDRFSDHLDEALLRLKVGAWNSLSPLLDYEAELQKEHERQIIMTKLRAQALAGLLAAGESSVHVRQELGLFGPETRGRTCTEAAGAHAHGRFAEEEGLEGASRL